MKIITITTPFITLGQLLKLIRIVDSGAMVKHYLLEHEVVINDIADNRRGRKLYHNDKVRINNIVYQLHSSNCELNKEGSNE